MKSIFHLIICVVFISACGKNDPLDSLPEIEEVIVDSIHLDLVSLVPQGESDYFVVSDFTARISGKIWGCTYLEESDNQAMMLFSYNIVTNQIDIFSAPTNLGLSVFNNIEAGPDGKLYMHSSGIVHNAIAIFDTNTQSWSSIEVSGYVKGITVDEVNNALWIAHNQGVSRYQNGNLFTFDDTNSNLTRIESGSNYSFFGFALAVDKAGVIWYANQNELYVYVNEEWSLHPLSPTSEQYIITHIVPHESEGVFLKVPHESLYHLTFDMEISNYNNILELVAPQKLTINLLGRLADESIIYSHSGGFSFYNSSQDSTIQVDANNSLLPINNGALKLDRDTEGNIWIGGDNILGKLPNKW
jgi:ligand-binding sensor domain-containing protein